MARETGPLTDQQVAAAILLFNGTKPGIVAETVGVQPSVISKWKKKAEFRAYLDEMFETARTAVVARMRGLGTKAVETVETILTDPRADPHARLKAAGMVFQLLGINPKTVLEVTGAGGGPVEVEHSTSEANAVIARLLSGAPRQPIIDVPSEQAAELADQEIE